MIGWRKKDNKPPLRRQPSNLPSAERSVFSYYSSRSRVPERTQRRYAPPDAAKVRGRLMQRQWVKNLPSLVAVFAVVLSLLYCLGLDTNPKILVQTTSSVALAHRPLRDKSDYQQAARVILSRSLLSRSKLTIDTAAFKTALMQQYPEIADASVSLPLIGRRPVVSVATAQPIMLLTTARNEVYVLDARGKAIMRAQDLSSSIRDSLPVVNDETGLKVDVGTAVLPPNDVQFITAVVAQLKAKQLAVESMVLPAQQARELHMRIRGQPYYVKFNFATDARLAAGAFLAAKAKLDQDRAVPGEYIDVRVEERVYIK